MLTKPEPLARERARRKRHERAVTRLVREQVARRDGYCRVRPWSQRWYLQSCEGRSEWAHLSDHRRARTRGRAPERRHTTAGTVMLCARHHRLYDEARSFDIIQLTEHGADGPITVQVRGTQ